MPNINFLCNNNVQQLAEFKKNLQLLKPVWLATIFEVTQNFNNIIDSLWDNCNVWRNGW